MNEEKEKQDECTMDQRDSQGDADLCCCYVVNSDGAYEDPCYTPVEECCC